jgi:hypothetical protein
MKVTASDFILATLLSCIATALGAGFPPTAITNVTGVSSHAVSPTEQMLWVDSSAFSVTVSFPNASACVGCSFIVVDGTCTAGTNTINLVSFGTDKIMSAVPGGPWELNLNCYCVRLVSDGTGNWFGLTGP